MKSIKTIIFEAFAALPEEKQIKGLELLISDQGAHDVLVRAMREALVGAKSAQVTPVAVPVSTPDETPVVAPALSTIKSVPAPAMSKSVAPVPAPPRVIEAEKGEKTFNAENGYKMWTSFMKGVVNGSNVPWPTLQNLTVKLVESGQQFSEEDFGLFFSAARKADEMKRFIVSDKASAIYRQAPPEMLVVYLFEKDGKLDQIMGQLDSYEPGRIPPWLIANMFVFASAVEALDKNGSLPKEGVKRLRALWLKVDGLNGPKNLIEKLAAKVAGGGYSDKNPVPPATATIGDMLAAKNGKKSVTVN